jgi:hypothetical protein
MTKKLINNFINEGETLSTELLTSIFQEINSKLDFIQKEMSEMKADSKISDAEAKAKFTEHDVRIKTLESDKETRAKLPIKVEVANILFKGFLYTVAACSALTVFVALGKALHIPVVELIKAYVLG